MPSNSKRGTGDPSTYLGVERRQNERRVHVRFPFTASIEAVEPQSNTKIQGRTTDISSGGCYVDIINAFAVGTDVRIRLTKEGVSFEAEATVVLSQPRMGMGIAFRSAEPQQIRNLQQWLNEREESLPIRHRRRKFKTILAQTPWSNRGMF